MKKVPVYLINGFLESGKTEFIRYTITQPYFKIRKTTLLILCEFGEEEYPKGILEATHTVVEEIHDEQEFSKENLIALEKKYNPERIIVEYNGMWNPKNMTMPDNWILEQQITTIDASTFPVFYTNMKPLVSEQIRRSSLIIFNRCTDQSVLPSYKRNVKAVNPQAEIVFEDRDGEINVSLEEDLPYDLNAEVISLDDLGYIAWYIDILDNGERYDGKTIEFVGCVGRPHYFEMDTFIPGRTAMTCCAEDMNFIGFICKWKDGASLKPEDWVKVRARICIEEADEYDGPGPVLYADSVELCSPPENQVIDLSNLS